MHFTSAFTVEASLTQVGEFHRRSVNLAALSPPPIRIRTNQTGPTFVGDVFTLTLGVGPITIDWRLQVVRLSRDGFTDEQISGPFRRWIHRHRFRQLESGLTEIRDEIEFQFRSDWPAWVLGRIIAFGLRPLFLYRKWRTRTLLERSNFVPGEDNAARYSN